MVYLQTDCLKTDVKYGTNRKEDVMFNGSMRVSQPHASKYYIKMSRSRKKFPAGVNCLFVAASLRRRERKWHPGGSDEK